MLRFFTPADALLQRCGVTWLRHRLALCLLQATLGRYSGGAKLQIALGSPTSLFSSITGRTAFSVQVSCIRLCSHTRSLHMPVFHAFGQFVLTWGGIPHGVSAYHLGPATTSLRLCAFFPWVWCTSRGAQHTASPYSVGVHPAFGSRHSQPRAECVLSVGW